MTTPHRVGQVAKAELLIADHLEAWLPIVGYEGLYEVSNQGRVRSHYRGGRILRPGLNSCGYPSVALHRDGAGQSWTIHRLVADAFCPRQQGQTVIRHRDGTRTNNAASNLSWGTPSENTYDAVHHGTHKDARKTHCAQGHEFTPENTGWARGGRKRVCRTCSRAWTHGYRAGRAAS